MDYDKMTKAQLIEELTKKKHLASAVESKDNQIANLRNQKLEEKEKYDEALRLIKEELQSKENLLKNYISKEQFQEEVDKVWKDAEEAVEKANLVLKTYNQFLSMMNSAMTLINQNDSYMSEKIK